MRAAAMVMAIVVLGASAHAPRFFPARFRGGDVPAVPQMTPGGGEVFLQVVVDPHGRVADVVPLRATPPFTDLLAAAVPLRPPRPFTDLLVDAVHGWQFLPALDENGPVTASVFVAGIFGAPALFPRALRAAPRGPSAATGSAKRRATWRRRRPTCRFPSRSRCRRFPRPRSREGPRCSKRKWGR